MTASLPPPVPSAYTLREPMREPAVSPHIFRAQPDQGVREELILKKLGPKGWGRVLHFRHYYEGGWGEGNLPSLSPRALDAFHRFLEVVEFPRHAKRPSVFLTDHGGLELCWEDSNGQSVQVEFSRVGLQYYRAATQHEAAVGFDEIERAAKELSFY